MSAILYYSTFCKHSKELLQFCSRLNITNEIHFLSIDKRIKKGNETYIILENGTEILLPNVIRCVPSLLLLNNSNKILEGDTIKEYIAQLLGGKGGSKNQQEQQQIKEPDAFSLGSLGGSVVSDQYSFWDQSSDEMSAKGNGGLKQLYNYATIEHVDVINPQPDNYKPDKIGNVSLDKLIAERDRDIPQQQRRF